MFKRQAKQPGRSFWLRPSFTNVTLVEAANGVFSSLILAETDFQDPSGDLNDTKKGAPVLERIICDIGFAHLVSSAFFEPAGFNQVTMLVEAMLFTQSDQFASLVTDSVSFDSVLNNERILGYGIMDYQGQISSLVNSRQQVAIHRTFEPKVRVRLREAAVGVAIRTNFDVANSAELSNFPWVQPTMLVRVP